MHSLSWFQNGFKLYIFFAQLSISKRTKFYSDIVRKSEGDQRALFKVVTTVMDKRKTCGNLPNRESANVLAKKFNDFYSNKVLQIINNINIKI